MSQCLSTKAGQVHLEVLAGQAEYLPDRAGAVVHAVEHRLSEVQEAPHQIQRQVGADGRNPVRDHRPLLVEVTHELAGTVARLGVRLRRRLWGARRSRRRRAARSRCRSLTPNLATVPFWTVSSGVAARRFDPKLQFTTARRPCLWTLRPANLVRSSQQSCR